MKDYCTGFFENWYRWDRETIVAPFYLGELCKKHDKECSSSTFFKDLITNHVVFGLLIGSVASIACWVKYPIQMLKRI